MRPRGAFKILVGYGSILCTFGFIRLRITLCKYATYSALAAWLCFAFNSLTIRRLFSNASHSRVHDNNTNDLPLTIFSQRTTTAPQSQRQTCLTLLDGVLSLLTPTTVSDPNLSPLRPLTGLPTLRILRRVRLTGATFSICSNAT